MSETVPLLFKWQDGALHPLSHRVAEQFAEGEMYRMVAIAERSAKTHKHFFAVVKDVWSNLPDSERLSHDPRTGEVIDRFPSPEHLRKWALVECGYSEDNTMVFESSAAARRAAILCRKLDPYCRVAVRGCVVLLRTAKSITDMSKAKDFQEMKTKVFHKFEDMLGSRRGEVGKHAGKAA